jgi:hypothetical protein
LIVPPSFTGFATSLDPAREDQVTAYPVSPLQVLHARSFKIGVLITVGAGLQALFFRPFERNPVLLSPKNIPNDFILISQLKVLTAHLGSLMAGVLTLIPFLYHCRNIAF